MITYVFHQNSIKANLLLVFVCLFSVSYCPAQLTDLARLEYSFIPYKNSEDDYTRLRAIFNVPLELREDTYLVIGTEYNLISLDLNENYPFDTSLLERIHVIDANLGYTYKMNDRWRFAAKFGPRIASTLNANITSADIFYIGGVYFINDRSEDEGKKPYRLILGLSYNSTIGIPFPLPIISYQREINDKWSFAVGIPKTNLKYALNASNVFQVFATLDGYYANIQKPLVINGQQADHISLSVIISGLGYEYQFTKHLVSYIYTGYTLSLVNDLNDGDRDSIFKLSDVNTFYFRTGLKFKL